MFMRPTLNSSRDASDDGMDGWDGTVISPGRERRCYTTEVRPGEPRPRGAHSVTTHPNPDKRREGWRLAWFLKVLAFVIVIGGAVIATAAYA